MTTIRSPQPGLPQRAGDGPGSGRITRPDRTPRVPPNGQPYVERRPRAPVEEPRQPGQVDAPRVTRQVREEQTPTDHDGVALDSGWERVDPPSNCVYYDWSDVSLRRIAPLDHAKITRASRGENLSLMLDVSSALCTRDVRDMGLIDFYALCYWHRQNSYPPSPTTVTWNSRYGARFTARALGVQLETRRLTATRDEYLRWVTDHGLRVPTMRDLETLEQLQDEDVATMFERAQFIDPVPLRDEIEDLRRRGDRAPSVTARNRELQRRGTSTYPLITEFSETFGACGVTEYARVVAPLVASDDTPAFDPDVAVQALRRKGAPPEDLHEADQIVEAMTRGEQYQPREERMPLTFNLWRMFPYV